MKYLFQQWRASYSGLSRAIWLLAVVNFVNRFGSMVIVFLTIYLTQELHFSIAQMGIMMGFCFGGGALAGAFIGGKLVDTIGYHKIQIGSLVLNGLILLSLLLIRSYGAMCVAIFVMSLVGEAFRPANQVAMGRYSTPENRTRSVSLMRMAFNLGWTIAPALGGLLKELFGWSLLFWIDGLTCIAAAALIIWWLGPPVTADQAPPVSADPIATLTAVEDNSPYRDKHFLIFVGLTFLAGVIFMQMLWNIPVFFETTYNWSVGTIGLVTALNGAIVFLVEMPLIYTIEHKRSKLWFVRLGLILYAVSYLALNVSFMAGFAAAICYITAISFGEIFVMPFSSNFVYGRSEGSSSRGQYMALYTMAYSVANIAAPLFGTQIIEHYGFATLWWIVSALCVVAWLGFQWLENDLATAKLVQVSG